jgi:hypothetical protein
MYCLNLPAGASIRLSASARPNLGLHRWSAQLFAAGDASGALPRVSYGSQIGGQDCEQRIDVPLQDRDCRLEIRCSHAAGFDWQDNRISIEDDTPNLVSLGYSNPGSTASRKDDVTLSFTFAAAAGAPLAGLGSSVSA